MDHAYGERYRLLYERHWWWRARERLILAKLSRRKPLEGFGPILDVGCGDGLFFQRLREFGLPEGVEPDARLVRETGTRDGKIHLCPFDEQFQPGRQFGAILMLDVLEHIQDDRAALRHAVSMLAPAGIVLITVPAFAALWTAHDELNHHLRRYTKGSLREVAREAGLHVESAEYFFSWMCPIKLLVRASEWIFPRQPTLPTVPPPWINRTLCSLSLREQSIGRYVPLPLGSSLIIIGRRMDAR